MNNYVRIHFTIPVSEAMTLKQLAELNDREYRAQARSMLRRAIKTACKRLPAEAENQKAPNAQ